MSEPRIVRYNSVETSSGAIYHDAYDPELAELTGPTVLVSRVRDQRLIEVPQALADDPPAFAAMLDWYPPARDDVRSLMQGFARAREKAFPDGCPWGKPPGCRCANCYQPGGAGNA
jgi:hypothetical protein